MDFDSDKAMLDALCEHTGLAPTTLAKKAGLAATTITRIVNNKADNELSAKTLRQLRETYPDFPGFAKTPEQLPTDPKRDYLPVEILPSFAGMGGGGTGDGEPAMGMVARHVIEDELRAKASDMLLVDVRGDSNEPLFRHGDQVLIDKRDTSPVQPGFFCVWDGDGYVLKRIERVPGSSSVRVSSANEAYSPYEVLGEELQIMGRPVWFARRL